MIKRYVLIAVSMALVQGCSTTPPSQASSYGSGYSDVSVGIHYSTYPDLVRIPGYPVYYAPRVASNYFFYDGLYWVFQRDNWYASSWYNGPWARVGYYEVPVYILRVPVRYYRQPPPYFRHWRADAPPRWGDRWGRDWEQRRTGWDRWDHRAAPAAAPLPAYQRNYSGDRYPRAVEQQHTIRSENYHYQPRESVTQQYFRPRAQQDQRQQDQRQHERRQLEQRQQEQRQLEQQRRQDQQRQLEQQQRQQDQRQVEQQQRQLELQRRQEQQRQREPQRRQESQRQQDPQQQRDLERQRSQPESRGKARDNKAAPHDEVQQERESRQEYERRQKEYEERYQNR